MPLTASRCFVGFPPPEYQKPHRQGSSGYRARPSQWQTALSGQIQNLQASILAQAESCYTSWWQLSLAGIGTIAGYQRRKNHNRRRRLENAQNAPLEDPEWPTPALYDLYLQLGKKTPATMSWESIQPFAAGPAAYTKQHQPLAPKPAPWRSPKTGAQEQPLPFMREAGLSETGPYKETASGVQLGIFVLMPHVCFEPHLGDMDIAIGLACPEIRASL
ncbi:hypothetical protein MKEN_01245700 [Mycena kentingensis (nom. inval.)]|nr:hypothetical protein MKEN_01245700 [Mycena kentingensis (nom. inval.)]